MDIVELFKSWAEENEWEFRYAPNSILNFTDAWRPTVDDSLYFLLLPVERTPVINEMGVVELMNYTVSAMLVKKTDIDSGTHPEEGTDYYYEKYTENISPIYLELIGAISGFTCGEVTFSDVNIREVVNLFDTNLDGVFFTGSLTGVDITEDLDVFQYTQSGGILPCPTKLVIDVEGLDTKTVDSADLPSGLAHLVQLWIDGSQIQGGVSYVGGDIVVDWGYTAGVNSYIVIF